MIFSHIFTNMANRGQKIILLGFMGCGKSTVGRALSKGMEMRFVDLDDAIEIREETTISDIFKHKGEKAFRDIETSTLQKALLLESIVISLGGGTPCFNNNMSEVNHDSISVYLRVSPEKLAERLFKERAHRPLIENYNSDEELSDFIKAKLEEREPFYKMARYTINAQQSVEKIVQEITSLLNS
jgi:shikimate kinase